MKQHIKQKGFSPILVVLIFSALFVLAGTGYWYSVENKKNNQEAIKQEQSKQEQQEQVVPEETTKEVVENKPGEEVTAEQPKVEVGKETVDKITAVPGVITPSDKPGWNLYKNDQNKEWKIEFKYPADWNLKEIRVTDEGYQMNKQAGITNSRAIGTLTGIYITKDGQYISISDKAMGIMDDVNIAYPDYYVSGYKAKTLWASETKTSFRLAVALYPACGGIWFSIETSSKMIVDEFLSSVICQ